MYIIINDFYLTIPVGIYNQTIYYIVTPYYLTRYIVSAAFSFLL